MARTLERALALGPRRAVVEAETGASLSYAALALRATHSAELLVRRGLMPGDPVAVVLPVGCRFPIAAHAVTVAGGHALPFEEGPGLGVRLAAARARIMITDLAHADELAQEASIRQVYSFSPVSGAMPLPCPPGPEPEPGGVNGVVLVTAPDLGAFDLAFDAGALVVTAREPSPEACRELVGCHGVTLVAGRRHLVDRLGDLVPVMAVGG
ncbi:AMP-binding protein [Nonomuraea sp. NPDC050663]|uniref:AMP-binding protein n=1 Tax=Nonomuraea sp. NPDC050663 TaxID=3364370 RepID=UPI0037896939